MPRGRHKDPLRHVRGNRRRRKAIERSVAERHLRVHTEQRRHLPIIGLPASADIAQVFLDTLPFGVAVRDLVAKTTTQAHITEGLLDTIEAALPAGR